MAKPQRKNTEAKAKESLSRRRAVTPPPPGGADSGAVGQSPTEENISAPNSDSSLPDFSEQAAERLLPCFDETASGLAYHDTYLRAKTLHCWPRLLRATSAAYWLVNHPKAVPAAIVGEWTEAQLDHFVAEVKLEGREAFPDFTQRIAWLRAKGFHDHATQAINAAKNFASHPAKGHTGQRGLRLYLAVLWLPACLWMLDNGRIAAALPLLRNRDGNRFLTDWEGIDSIEGQDIAALKRRLTLPSAEDLVGVPCADIGENGELRSIDWERLKLAPA